MAQIVVPTLGESVTEATVAKWLKREGEAVKADEPLVELETDKVTLEVNAPSSVTLIKITAQAGAAVKVGALLGEVAAGAAASAAAPVPSSPPANDPKKPAAVAATGPTPGPAARKMMVDQNINPATLSGTGKDGRITKADVMAGPAVAVPTAMPSAFSAPARAAGPREEKVKMTRLRQRIAQRLKDAQNTAAMLTTFNEVDMTAIMAMRDAYKDGFEKKYGIKLGFMSFFAKAAVNALREFPAVNAEIAGDEIIYKNYYDISVAVSAPQGLVVPVIRDCAGKSMAQIESELAALAVKARDGKLSMEEMTGGTFTVTNGGVFGSLMSTPILNPPQSGILGMHKTMMRPMVLKDGSIAARPMMYIALSYDHRIVDGREAVGFLVRVKEAIEDPQRLLLEI